MLQKTKEFTLSKYFDLNFHVQEVNVEQTKCNARTLRSSWVRTLVGVNLTLTTPGDFVIEKQRLEGFSSSTSNSIIAEYLKVVHQK